MKLAGTLFNWLVIIILAGAVAWPYVDDVRDLTAEHLVRDDTQFERLDESIRSVHFGAQSLYAELLGLLQFVLPPQYVTVDPPGSPGPFEAHAEGRALFDRVNEARAEHGVPPVEWDDGLARVATGHSQDMADHGFFAHESPRTGGPNDRCAADEDVIWRFRGCGENLARHGSVDSAHRGLMDSPGHRENILSPDYTHLGVGVVRLPDGSRLYTQKFGVVRPEDRTRTVLFSPRLGQTVSVDGAQIVVRGRAQRSGPAPVVWVQREDSPQATRQVFRVDGHFELTLPLDHGSGVYQIYAGQQTVLQLEGVRWARVNYQP